MTPAPHPPRFARWLLRQALPDDVRNEITGDLHELFLRRRARAGAVGAWRWYWRQACSFTVRFLTERLRERRRTVDMSTGMSWIDLKLALRMLVRYPGLTLVGVLGMAVGIAVSTAAFTIAWGLLLPSIPLDEGNRIVSLLNWDARTNNNEPRVLSDYVTWRDHLRSVQDVGAFRTVGRNLIADRVQPENVTVAEITASGFRVARVAPLLGRHLMPEDERAGAPDVVVIGEEVWRRRFSSDPSILTKQIQLGATTHAVVGVMPGGFAFPVSHSYWIPLRLPAGSEPRSGPALKVFGRLAPGTTLDTAQAELAALGQRAAEANPATHEHLRARVVPYSYAFTDMDDPDNALALHLTQTLIVMLLILVCVNVSILVYARTATRLGEIAVRTALGASRRRIVGQLFLEALVLAAAAAVIGVGLVSVGLRQLDAALLQLTVTLPFWMRFELPFESLFYVMGLTVLCAAIVGVVPALKATGRLVQARLQGLSAGSGSRMQMGRLWTLLIVAQVAVAVAVLPATVYHAWNSLRFRTGDRGFASQEFLTTTLAMEREGLVPSEAGERDFLARYGGRQGELERRLEAEAAVAGVTFSLADPGGELAGVIEIEGVTPPVDPVNYNIVEGSRQGHLVRFNRIAPDFFDTFDVPLLTGRQLGPDDADRPGEAATRGILVNRAFVQRLLGGGNALGRRVRYVGRSREAGQGNLRLGRWYEIVGVVTDFPPYAMHSDGSDARVYHVAAPGDLYPAVLSVRVRGGAPSAFADRLREVSAAVDPILQLRELSTADEAVRREQGLMRLIGFTLSAVTLSVIVLAAAGIYAMMSFTVARRRREIGIRAALGADPARLLAGIFSRAFLQLGVGAGLGMLGAIALEGVLEGEMFQGRGAFVLPLVAVCTTLVGLLAALGPARRGLQIQPTEALREE